MFTQMPNFAEGGFEFLRKLWGGGFAGMPGAGMPNMASFAAPPMDLEELDKRIHDLRAVESWLQLNASLLRTAIQGLEVQRATLVALQTFGSALSPEAMKSAFDGLTPAASPPDGESKPAWPHTAATAKPAQPEAAAPEDKAEDEAEAEAEDTDDDQAEARAQSARSAEHAQAAARAAAAALDPSPWWNMLQQQFNQIASSAAAAMPMPQNLMPGFPGGFPGFGGAPGAEGLDTAPEDIEEPSASAKSKRAGSKPARGSAAKAPAGKTAKPAGKTATKKAPAKTAPRKPANGNS
jgi:hypothetical protein